MADEKITVSWDDLTSRKVERRLKEQDALARNRDYATINEALLHQRETLREQRLAEVLAQERLKTLIRNVLGYGLSGVLLALFLAIAIPVTERNGHAIVINGAAGAALGLIGGICVALLVDKVF